MSQPRQILHLVSSLDGYGQSRQLRLLAEKQIADGDQVRIAALSADRRVRRAFETAGASCQVLRQRWTYDPIAAWRLARELRERPHDILHVWGLAALRYANFARASSAVPPYLATLVSLPSGRFQAKADCLVVPTSPVSNDKNVIAIAPGVAPPRSDRRSRAALFGQIGLPTDSRLIAIAGRLVRSRNIDDAIWCFELVRTLDERAKLLIFGDGPDRHRLERFARLTSDPSVVRFLGYRDDLDHWLRHVDVFWQPRGEQSSAALPLAALEAMAAEVPVVAIDVPAHRLIIAAGRTGYLVPAGSRALCARHTLRLLKDEEHSSALAAAAAAEVSRCFSLEAYLRGYVQLYQRLLTVSR